MIHQAEDGTCTLSARNCWRPGVFADAAAARKAIRWPDVVLQFLQDAANERAGGKGGIVTSVDIDNYRRDCKVEQ